MTSAPPGTVRLLLHALDRTGPPVLGLGFARWLLRHHADVRVETVAFRGGPMVDDFTELGPVVVLLDPSEPWDHGVERPDAGDRLVQRARRLSDADLMLSVSVAGTQSLPYLPEPLPPLFTWVVERGEDLHWIGSPVHDAVLSSRWLAGSLGSATDLAAAVTGDPEIRIVPEFVEPHDLPAPHVIANRRLALGAAHNQLLVVGAGIATERKAPDLFIEVAARSAQRDDLSFVWIGGEHDERFHQYVTEARRLGHVGPRFMGNVTDISGWLAAADVFCHTARLDAFPLVCLHAALAGTPVIGFAGVAGLEEMFGAAALTVPYPDVAGLGELLEELADPCRRDEVAAAQCAAATERHVSDVAGPALLAELLGPSGSRAAVG